MSSLNFDRKVWKFIEEFYEKQLEDNREKNQLEAYWCRPEGENQTLFTDPKQRMFARFLKSYQNTTWHKVQLICKNADEENGRDIMRDTRGLSFFSV